MYTCQCVGLRTNGIEQWCPVKGGGCISEVFFHRGQLAPAAGAVWHYQHNEHGGVGLNREFF